MATPTKPVKPRDWPAEAERLAKQLTPDDRAWIANRVGLPVSAIAAIPLLGKVGVNQFGIITTWPEMNAVGTVTCLTDRIPGEPKDAKKRQENGKWGLTYPHGWRDRPGPLFVVEGPTDAAAMTAAGLCCVARPSNSGGADLLAELLADWPADRAIVILGEWDQKPNGLWPGKTGMDSVAKELGKLLGRPILTALPPQGTKDVLEWLTNPARGEATWPERGRELSEYLLSNAVTINPPGNRRQVTSPSTVSVEEPQGDGGPTKSPFEQLYTALDSVFEDGKIDLTTDLANGIFFARDHNENARYTAERGWYSWNGCRWVHDDVGELMRMGKETAAKRLQKAVDMFQIPQTDGERAKAKELIKSAIGTQSKVRLVNMLELAQTELSIPARLSDFDKLPDAAFLLNCANGTLDLRTGDLRPHERGDMLTQICATAFDPSAKCPTWERFVNAIFAGDTELVTFVQRWLGYVLSGDTSIHVCPVLWGGGSNGKGVLIETVFEVMGGHYAGKAAPDLLIAKHGETHPTGRADLRGKRLVALTETAEGARIDEPLLKELTGGDRIKARFMRQDFFEFRPTHKVCIITNHRPRVKEGGHGIWRRLRLIPFDVRFWGDGDEPGPDHLKADIGLNVKLIAESPGILAWMVRGFKDFQAAGMSLGTPAAVMNATKAYEEAEDIVGQFIAERCELNSRAEEKAKDVYDAYVKWHESESDGKPFTKTQFGSRLKAKGIGKRKSGVYIYTGIRLREQSTTGEELGQLGQLDANSRLSAVLPPSYGAYTENGVQLSQLSQDQRTSSPPEHGETARHHADSEPDVYRKAREWNDGAKERAKKCIAKKP